MEPVKLGVIGWGGRAQGLIRGVLAKGGSHLFEMTAVSDLFQKKLDLAHDEFGMAESALYLDYHGLLEDSNVEAVLVETGAQVMAAISCDALNAGKHVCVDVPMAFTRQEVWDLIVTVEKTGCAYCMGEQVRFANFVKKWKEHIGRGDIGEPLFIQGEYIHPSAAPYFVHKETGDPYPGTLEEAARDPNYRPTWRNKLTDPIKYIPHETSPLLKILDDRIARVSCYTCDKRMYGDAIAKQDLQCALMQTDEDRVVRIINSFTAPRKGNYAHHWYHIMGTDGVLESSRPLWGDDAFQRKEELLLDRDGNARHTTYGWAREEDNPFKDSTGGHAGLEAFVFQQFYDAIRGDGNNELDVYTMGEVVLPGIIAAESAAAGGVQIAVPSVRPSAERPKGSYPKS